jgi:hypothetical protein
MNFPFLISHRSLLQIPRSSCSRGPGRASQSLVQGKRRAAACSSVVLGGRRSVLCRRPRKARCELGTAHSRRHCWSNGSDECRRFERREKKAERFDARNPGPNNSKLEFGVQVNNAPGNFWRTKVVQLRFEQNTKKEVCSCFCVQQQSLCSGECVRSSSAVWTGGRGAGVLSRDRNADSLSLGQSDSSAVAESAVRRRRVELERRLFAE